MWLYKKTWELLSRLFGMLISFVGDEMQYVVCCQIILLVHVYFRALTTF